MIYLAFEETGSRRKRNSRKQLVWLSIMDGDKVPTRLASPFMFRFWRLVVHQLRDSFYFTELSRYATNQLSPIRISLDIHCVTVKHRMYHS